MSAECSSYYTSERELIGAFTCPRAGGDARAVYCCGFNDVKYCWSDSGPQEGSSQRSAPSGPQGFRKHFLRGKLHCDNQPPDPERLFQRCYMATVTTINVEGPS
ncbi:hypothetical protein HF521_006430 [Silurus meridionalis]|uniref:Shisa N-terminal domain-containing protein n=1 Tax=Silurus meridionalis TaxID=175797 RepID=A0A8T0AW90_SILME|nr:hypothetical protein HF521_006430 [Silurus meridionalis]